MPRISGWTETECSRGHSVAEHGKTRKGTGARRCRKCERDAYALKPRKSHTRTREEHLQYNYKLSLADYDQMHTNQDGLCAICHKLEPRGLRVDHDHETKKVRALLCHHCNVALGHFKDNPELIRRAAEYVEAHQLISEIS